MKIKPSFLVSSLLVGAVVTLETAPVQAFILQRTPNYSENLIGITETFTDNLGRNLNVNFLSSPSFSFNSFSGNGTNSVTASFFGGAVPANTPFIVNIDIGDLPGDNSANVKVTQQAYTIVNGVPTGLTPIPLGFSCTSSGNGSSFLAAQATFPQGNILASLNSDTALLQCQGNTLAAINNTDTPFNTQFTSKSIPGYQNSDNLGTFPPPQTITIQPGSNIVASVPEPSSILGTLAFSTLSAALLLKRKQLALLYPSKQYSKVDQSNN